MRGTKDSGGYWEGVPAFGVLAELGTRIETGRVSSSCTEDRVRLLSAAGCFALVEGSRMGISPAAAYNPLDALTRCAILGASGEKRSKRP
mgnify:CR=1 FL=1